MTSERPKLLFVSLLLLDNSLAVAAGLIRQAVTVGFDPIFANPGFISVLIVFMTIIGSYVPFFVFYKLLFEIIVRKGFKISPVALCLIFFVGLTVVSLAITIVGFGAQFNPSGAFVPIGLAVINVGVFYMRRVRGLVRSNRECNTTADG